MSEPTEVLPGHADLGLAQPEAPAAVRALRAFARFCVTKKVGAFGLFVCTIMVLIGLLGPVIAPYGKDEVFSKPNPNYDVNSLEEDALNPTILQRLEDPSWDHPLGTDDKGRDLLTRILLGARLSLQVGVASAALATFLGTILGLVSGYIGGVVDLLLQRLVDAMIAVPGIIFLLLLVQVSEPNMRNIIIALSVLGTFSASRVVRSAVLVVRSEVYVEAARAIGAGPARIMAVHVLRNVVAPVIVIFSIAIGANILAEAGLSFLGLGVPGASWGQIVSAGRQFLDNKPMMSIVAGGAITITVLGFNLLGDALRDVFDPRQRGVG